MPVEIAGNERERGAIAGGEQIRLVLLAATPDRTDRVDHVTRLQPVAARDLGGSGLAAAERVAFGLQLGAGGAVNRSIDPTAADETGIGGVDDGIDVERGDVGNDDLEPCRADFGDNRKIHGENHYAAMVLDSIVLRSPMSSKCVSRKRSAARRPARCSISKKSKLVFRRLAAVSRRPTRAMRCRLTG